MQKEFYPNIEFNRKRRTKLFVYFAILVLLMGGFSAFLFATKQTSMAIMMLGLIIVFLFMSSSGLNQYPVKHKPLIIIDGKSATFAPNETVSVSQITAVSICIEVPVISKVEKENKEFLLKVSSEKPTEPILGACDVTIRNRKGKEVIKYAIIDDCLGALEEFLKMGVKKYRIIYSQKRNTEEAKYSMNGGADGAKQETLATMSEKDKLDQLM